MRYEGTVYRPPSEARSYLLQATVGCSHNLCTYCDMYRDKRFRERDLEDVITDISLAARVRPGTEKVFVMDGDALIMGADRWHTLLAALRAAFPRLRQVSCYATASNVLAKSDADLLALRAAGLRLLYIGPESGDDVTLRRIVKGGTFADHALAAARARAAGMALSVIMLLGAGGVERGEEHAHESARLITAMDPEYLSALTLTVIPGRRSRGWWKGVDSSSRQSPPCSANSARWSPRPGPLRPSSGPTTHRTTCRFRASFPAIGSGSWPRSMPRSEAESRSGRSAFEGCSPARLRSSHPPDPRPRLARRFHARVYWRGNHRSARTEATDHDGHTA